RLARRQAGAAHRRAAAWPAIGAVGETEFDLLQPADLVAQPGGFLEFEIGGGDAHALFHIGDDRLQILALVVRRIALAEADRDVIGLVDAVENVGDAAAHGFGRDAVQRVARPLLFAAPGSLGAGRVLALGHGARGRR